MRIDRTPKLEISSKADVRVAGLARSTGASNVMDWLLAACAALGRAAATSAQRVRASGAIRDMSGGGGVVRTTDRRRPRLRCRARRYPDGLGFGAMPVAPAPDDIVASHADAERHQ